MRTILLLTLATGALDAQAPAAPDSAERARIIAELDRDVWRPWVRGVRLDSAALYVGVHAPDFRWIAPGPRGLVMDLAEYDRDSREVMARRKADGSSTEIDVRFLERNVRPDFAAEKVVTRWTIRRPGREPQTGYGIAHHFSRREHGAWRIYLRHGSTERATAEQFGAAEPVTEP